MWKNPRHMAVHGQNKRAKNGAGGRTRTGTSLRKSDFKSVMYRNKYLILMHIFNSYLKVCKFMCKIYNIISN